MALTLPGHRAPAVGFEVPLEMLAACPGRVQLLPMAARLLNDAELDRIGVAMRHRRQSANIV